MKQTNNAIKFLMAQYRAIFKNANIAMVAAIAAAALASGQAQAAKGGATFDDAKFGAADANVTIDGTTNDTSPADNAYGTLTITSAANRTATEPLKVTINGGTSHTIKGTAAGKDPTTTPAKPDVNLGNTSLVIEATADATLTIGESGGGGGTPAAAATNVTLANITVNKGTLALVAKDDNAQLATSVTAANLTVGLGDTAKAADEAKVTVAKHTSINATEALTVNSGSKITVAGGGTLSGTTVTINDGTVELGDGGDADNLGTLSSTGKLDIKGGEVSVATGGFAKITGQTIDLAGTLTNAGTLSVSGLLTAKDQSTVANSESVTFENGLAADSGSTINNNTDDKTITLKGTSTFAEGATVSNSGDLVVEGTATFNSAATDITADAASTLKVVSGGTANMSSAVLKSFLTGKVQSTADNSGTINLTDSGDTAIALGDGGVGIFSAAGAMNANLGVENQGSLKVTADKAKFEGANEVSGAAANAGVTLAFNELSLGKDSAAVVVKGVNLEIAKDIKIKDNKGLTLQNGAKLTLNGTGKALDLESITLGEATPSSGSLNVASGAWGVKTLTVTKGEAKVEKGAKLTVTKGLTTTNASGKLVINGGTVNAKDVETLKLNANGASITNAGKLILSSDMVVKAADSTLITDKYDKNAVQGTTDAQISLLDKSGNAISMTLEKFKQFRKDTGFKGLFDIKLSDKPTTQPQMGLGGDAGVAPGVTNGYEDVQGKVDSTGVNDNYFVGNTIVSGGDTVSLKDGGALTLTNANANRANGQYVTVDGEAKAVGNVKFEANNTLVLGGTGGKIGSVTATNNGSGSVTIANGANVEVVAGSFGTNATTTLGTVNINDGAQLNVKSGSVFTNDLSVGKGGYVFASGDVVVKKTATIMGDVDAGKLSLESGSTIAGGAKVDVATLELGNAASSLTIGKDKVGDEPSSTAAVFAETLMFKAGKIFVDPAYTEKASVLAVQEIKGGENKEDVGVLAGGLYVGQNAAFGYGFDEAEFNSVMANYLVDGKFADPRVPGATGPANALVLNKPLSVKYDNGIIVKHDITDATVNGNIPKNTLELGKNAALIITDNAFGADKSQPAITFTSGAGTTTVAAKVQAAEGAKVSLIGDITAKDTGLKIFAAQGTGSTVTASGDLVVEAAGGLLTYTYANGADLSTTGVTLKLDPEVEKQIRSLVSAPVGQMFVDYANGEFSGASGLGYDFVVNTLTAKQYGAIDAAAHAATYAGAQQAAVAAVTTMADAMFGRVGAVGVEAATISATGSQANGGVWLTPMYKSVDSDGFNAEGVSYGSDVDLAGVAFGTDTVNGNMRFGAVFNIGSGDAEGKGQGNGLKDEFDYYGIGIYSAMGFGNFALVGDASMTVISHDVEGLGLSGKADTKAVTMGLTGQYTISTAAVDVTPHLGARFIRLNTDSYDLMSADGAIATTDFDVQNVFSIPLGVTLSKAFNTSGWTLAPSADLTVAFNTGDTEAKSHTQFNSTKPMAVAMNTEVLDEVQYGLTFGLGAQYGAFGTSFGINYTGSSNTDSFGVNAQARYMF
ncbi:MAG: autotransporter outer membrane beta-barrel domain-containing protein [Anaerobiospirillum succiniciproducens]|uniref:beta strand repeat-containing protein n=1 Tax=Anaerobiospirillum succiniciproducens TaxID=13335 RepID=UPI0026DC727C|nr:autotransporter outer membrane beta-barrel domain-containing protein [Anaerobiospirillum succiniciproducens]MDO4676565.1 autotransporter outer membrane beta-barrel domain-containing protein [Anaerobiospirillum succiniciproducens]